MHRKGKQILVTGESYKIGHQYLFLLYIYVIHNVHVIQFSVYNTLM